MAPRNAPTIVMSAVAPKEVYNYRVYLIALVASMGAFIFGYDLAFIGKKSAVSPSKEMC